MTRHTCEICGDKARSEVEPGVWLCPMHYYRSVQGISSSVDEEAVK